MLSLCDLASSGIVILIAVCRRLSYVCVEFDLTLYISVNNVSVMLGWVSLGGTITKQGLM